jgi:hypothetical protein
VVSDTGVQLPVVGGGADGRENWTKKDQIFVFPCETYLWILGLVGSDGFGSSPIILESRFPPFDYSSI